MRITFTDHGDLAGPEAYYYYYYIVSAYWTVLLIWRRTCICSLQGLQYSYFYLYIPLSPLYFCTSFPSPSTSYYLMLWVFSLQPLPPNLAKTIILWYQSRGAHFHLSLPPPPRYPVQNNAYNSTAAGGMATPTNMETHNVLSHPDGPEYQLVVGEGRLLGFLRRPLSSHAHPAQ